MKLSTLSILLGLVFAAPNVYGVLKPAQFATAARKFPRYTPIGYVLMLIATFWYLPALPVRNRRSSRLGICATKASAPLSNQELLKHQQAQ